MLIPSGERTGYECNLINKMFLMCTRPSPKASSAFNLIEIYRITLKGSGKFVNYALKIIFIKLTIYLINNKYNTTVLFNVMYGNRGKRMCKRYNVTF